MSMMAWAALLAAAATGLGSGPSFLGVPLGTNLQQFKVMKPQAKCGEARSYSNWISCAEPIEKSPLPVQTEDASATHYFDKATGRLYEIELMMSDLNYKAVEAYLGQTYGKPDKVEKDGPDQEWTWRRGAYSIRYDSSCEDEAMCLTFQHDAERKAVWNRGVPQ